MGVDLCDEQRAKQLLGDFELRNQQLIDGSWLKGWKEFCEENREHYTKAVANAFTPNSTEKENGVISLVTNGQITRNYNPVSAGAELRRLLLDTNQETASNAITKIIGKINIKRNKKNSKTQDKEKEAEK